MKLVLLITFYLLVSCVGTVQETKKEVTYGERLPSQSFLAFGGISKVVPISHSRIEIYFYPATGGSNDYSYLIYNSEYSQPITVNEQSIFRAYGGQYMYTIDNLNQGKIYSFRVDAKDNVDGTILQTDNYLEANTFSNRVADFHGISSASNAPGVAGIDSIIVTWPQASVPTSILETDYTTKEYRIIVLDSTNKGASPAQLHDESMPKEEGRLVYSVSIPAGQEFNPLVDSYTVTGLTEGSVYYVGVQCIHKSSIEDPSYPDLFGERNNKWIQIKTLSSNFNDVAIEEGTFVVSAGSGVQAYTSLNVQWGQIEAVFDHIRVYYGIGSASENGNCTSGSCKKITNTLDLSTTLADLESLTEYQVKLVVCADATCETSKVLGTTSATTSPSSGSFSGITEITPPRNISELGTVTVNFDTPDFSGGYFEGLALYYVAPEDNQAFVQWQAGESVVPDIEFIGPNPTATQLIFHEYFNMSLHTSFKVYGVNSSNPDDKHCFALVPYNTNSSGTRVDTISKKSAVWECVEYSPGVPNSVAFVGLTSAKTIGSKIIVQWDTPISGLYTDFALFLGLDNTFSYTDAIDSYMDPTSDYMRLLLPLEVTEDGAVVPLTTYEINSLANNTFYVGLRTYYMSSGEYSDSEDNVYQCTVSASNSTVQDCTLVGN